MNSQSINQMQNLQTIKSDQKGHENGASENIALGQGGKVNTQEVSISKAGQIGSYIANLPEAQQKEIKSFMQEVQAAKAGGSFDIESSMSNAPAAFKGLADQFNLNNEDALALVSENTANEVASLPNEGAKKSGVSAYTDVAAQTKGNEGGSVLDMFSSIFSSDAKA